MNSRNPKYNERGNKRFDGFNMVNLADPGLPFIQNFKSDIKIIGNFAEAEKGRFWLSSRFGDASCPQTVLQPYFEQVGAE